MPPAKYAEFLPMAPERRRGKHSPEETEYIEFVCPYCNGDSPKGNPEIKASLIAQKANVIKQHIQDCEACKTMYPDIYGKAPEKKRKYTNEDVINEIRKVEDRITKEMTEKMERMEKRICTKVSSICNVDPPPPESETELYDRLGDKQTDMDAERNKYRCMQSNAMQSEKPSQCAVCLVDDVTDVVTVPCMHRVLCWTCWEGVRNGATAALDEPKCPTCREKVQHALRVMQ